jgi:hypothetical protein
VSSLGVCELGGMSSAPPLMVAEEVPAAAAALTADPSWALRFFVSTSTGRGNEECVSCVV